ncbi:MAG: type IV secretory system conjugative DNA transfer family protein [Elusimicrobia bacterium]|nr:type IV secretory system conjugative DNA transfer family protein [Elusimicrobiota bacterium]
MLATAVVIALFLLILAVGATAMVGAFGLAPLLRLAAKGGGKLFLGLLFARKKEAPAGARFQGFFETLRHLHLGHGGLILDGNRRRISDKNAFRHLVLVAPTGAGKTTRFVIPNVLQLDRCSLVVTDPSGEIWEHTSGSLRHRGFDVQVLNLADPAASIGYNPLALVRTPLQSAEAARVIVRSSPASKGHNSEFWNQGAESLCDCLIQTLVAYGRPETTNLHNLLALFQQYGSAGQALDPFVFSHAPENALRTWIGLKSGHEKVRQSYVSTAIASLRMLEIPELARVLATPGLDFQALRRRPTALFLVFPATKIGLYAFVMNLLYAQGFAAWMERIPGPDDLPIFALMDEFGHSAIPDFSTILTNLRKYRVSVSMVLQSIAQLRANYGPDAAEVIMEGGVANRVVYGGADVHTTRWAESMLGHRVVKEKDRYRTEPLLRSDRIRTLTDAQALYIFANEEPVLISTVPYFKNPRLKHLAKRAPWNPCPGVGSEPLEYLDLAGFPPAPGAGRMPPDDEDDD